MGDSPVTSTVLGLGETVGTFGRSLPLVGGDKNAMVGAGGTGTVNDNSATGEDSAGIEEADLASDRYFVGDVAVVGLDVRFRREMIFAVAVDWNKVV